MNPAITATPERVSTACVGCLTGHAHTDHDAPLPVMQRSSITAPVPARPAPPLHEYLPFPGESDHYPSL